MNFCPKCGANITENDKFCPSCGAKLEEEKVIVEGEVKEETLDNEEYKVILRRDRSNDAQTMGIVFIVVGALISWFVIGIVLIGLGILLLIASDKNTKATNDLIYFNEDTNTFLFYDLDNAKYKVEAKDVVKLNRSSFQDRAYVTLKNVNKDIQLGFAHKFEIEKAIKFVEEQKNK